jgi:valyl-tRNA synthetase
LNHTIDLVTRDLTEYRFDEAANHLYRFVWHEFCDWYIELAKPRLSPDAPEHEAAATRATILDILETTLRLLHPFMPFITEEIWQKVPHAGDTIVLAPYPQPVAISSEDLGVEEIMDEVITVITTIRTMRSELNVPPAQKLRAGLKTGAPTAERIRRHGEGDVIRLARLADFQAGPDIEKPDGAVAHATPIGEVFVLLEGVDLEKERTRLQKNLREAQAELLRIDTKLKNPQFTARAPSEVIADHHRRRAELTEQSRMLSEQLASLGGNGSA